MRRLLFLLVLLSGNAFSAATILDALSTSSDSIHATITVSAGSDRYVYVILGRADGSDANPDTSCTLGGQSMTLLGGGNLVGGEDAAVTVWYLNESGISSMSGNTLSCSGGFDDVSSAWYSVQDANQAGGAHTVVTDSGNASSGTLSLTRAADSVTGAAITQDSVSMSGSDPTLTDIPISTFATLGAGAATDSSRTANVSWTGDTTRDYEIVAWNIGPASGGSQSPVPIILQQH